MNTTKEKREKILGAIYYIPFKFKIWCNDAPNRQAWRRISKPSRIRKLKNIYDYIKLIIGFILISIAVIFLFKISSSNELESASASKVKTTDTTSVAVNISETTTTTAIVFPGESITEDEELIPEESVCEELYALTEDDFNLLYKMVQQEFGSIETYIQELYWVDNDFNTYQVSLDVGIQATAKIIINQMINYGYSSIRETLTDTVQWGYSLEKLENVSVDYYDERILDNINRVLNNQDELPDNLVFERCTYGSEATSDVAEAYSYMQSYYPDHEIDVYLFALNTDGSWWMACTDPTLEE